MDKGVAYYILQFYSNILLPNSVKCVAPDIVYPVLDNGAGSHASSDDAVVASVTRLVFPWVLHVLPKTTPAHCIAAARAQQSCAAASAHFWDVSEARPSGMLDATVPPLLLPRINMSLTRQPHDHNRCAIYSM